MYLRAFINWQQNNLAKLLSIAEFAYNNIKKISTSHTPFKLNCGFYLKVSFKENINLYSGSCSTDKLAIKLKKLIELYYQNLLYT